MKYLFALIALVSGCATLVQPGPGPPPAPGPVTGPAPLPLPATPENAAIAGLFELARADAASGRLSNAAASLERALRIEPRNPRLWQALARVRLQQGEYAQAEGAAARSSSWAGSDAPLRAENWRLIAQSRQARGDGD